MRIISKHGCRTREQTLWQLFSVWDHRSRSCVTGADDAYFTRCWGPFRTLLLRYAISSFKKYLTYFHCTVHLQPVCVICLRLRGRSFENTFCHVCGVCYATPYNYKSSSVVVTSLVRPKLKLWMKLATIIKSIHFDGNRWSATLSAKPLNSQSV